MKNGHGSTRADQGMAATKGRRSTAQHDHYLYGTEKQ